MSTPGRSHRGIIALPSLCAAAAALVACSHAATGTASGGNGGSGGGAGQGTGGAALVDGGGGSSGDGGPDDVVAPDGGGGGDVAGGDGVGGDGVGGDAAQPTLTWSPAEPIALGTLLNGATMIDGAGNARVITAQINTTTGAFSSRSWSLAGGWQPPQSLFPCGACGSLGADMNAAGQGVLAWIDFDPSTPPSSDTFARRISGGQWESASQIAYPNVNARLSRVMMAPNGTAHVWQHSSSSFQIIDADPTGPWRVNSPSFSEEGTGLLTNGAFDAAGNGLSIFLDSANQPQFTRYDPHPAPPASPMWRPAQMLSDYVGPYSMEPAALAAAANGTFLLVTYDLFIDLETYTAAAGWSAPTTLLKTNVHSRDDLRLVADGNDFVAVWVENVDNQPQAVRTARYSNGGFGAIAPLPGTHAVGSGSARMGIDAQGNITYVWWVNGALLTIVSQRYFKAADQWSMPATVASGVHALTRLELDVSAAGPAVVTWVDDGYGVYAATSP